LIICLASLGIYLSLWNHLPKKHYNGLIKLWKV
jgi:hypothetical protein